MDTERLQNWLQLVGLLAVVASLIFVGQQLKLDRRIAIGDNWLQYVDTQVALSNLIAENAELWMAGLAGDELPPADALKFRQIAYAVEQKYASRYSRSELGVRTGPAEDIVVRFAHDLYAHPGLRKAVFARWSRLDAMSGRDRNFYTAVRRHLQLIDEGQIAPVSFDDYAH